MQLSGMGLTRVQSPITIKKEVNGFVLNRLQYALLMEAWRLVEVTRHQGKVCVH